MHIFSALTMKEARSLYGDALIDAASTEEVQTCIQKGVWECLGPNHPLIGAISSKMFLAPKKLPNGDIDKIKVRVVAGGHRLDRSLFQDSEISSPTVALTSVLAMAAIDSCPLFVVLSPNYWIASHLPCAFETQRSGTLHLGYILYI